MLKDKHIDFETSKLQKQIDRKKTGTTVVNNYPSSSGNEPIVETLLSKPVVTDMVAREEQYMAYNQDKEQWEPISHRGVMVYVREEEPTNQKEGDIWIRGSVDYLPLTGGTITGDLHVTGNITKGETWHAYGGFQDVSEALSMSGWTKVTNATNNLFVGLEADGFSLVDDGIIVANAGDYVGNVALTFIGSTTKDYHMRVYNVTQATQMGYVVGASGLGVGNYQHLVLPLYLECNAGDELQLEVIEAADTALTVTDCVFYMTYLHD